MPPPPRGRAMSLSLDWEKVLSEGPTKEQFRQMQSSVEEKPPVSFCTGSTYTGQWDSLGMSGFGTFLFPHGVEYEGSLKDGMFHGDGTLMYPMGQKIDGTWVKGRLSTYKYRFADGLEYEEPWKYCQLPDRGFGSQMQEGFQPAGKETLTNVVPTREIPEGCYDTGDGYFNPITKCVTSPSDPNKILRIPTASEEKWIIENCRKAWSVNTGYKPTLFEHWVSGRKEEMAEIEEKYEQSSKTSSGEGVDEDEEDASEHDDNWEN